VRNVAFSYTRCRGCPAVFCRSATGYFSVMPLVSDNIQNIVFRTAAGVDTAQYDYSQGCARSNLLCPAGIRMVGSAGRADRVLEALQMLCKGESGLACST
jgi:Pyruvate/2-oxoacid:ferredoxin oxidoreductase delta subunit